MLMKKRHILLRTKLKATSLIEVIFAITIASIVFLLTYSIVLNTMGGNQLFREAKYQTIVNNHLHIAIANRNIKPETFKTDQYSIVKTAETFNQMTNLYIIKYELVIPNQTKTFSSQALLYVP